MYKFSIKLSDYNTDSCGISNIDVKDGFFGMSLADMDGNCVQDSRDWLVRQMKRVVLYTVAIPLDDYDAYVRALHNARALGVEAVKICACVLGDCSQAQLDKLDKILKVAKAVNMPIAFEPKACYPSFTIDVYMKLRSEITRLVFNPSEYVKQNLNPFLTVLYKSKIKDDIYMLRVNDRLYDGDYVMPEKGNSEIKECASILLARSFNGYFSFTPYLDKVQYSEIIDAFLFTLTQM